MCLEFVFNSLSSAPTLYLTRLSLHQSFIWKTAAFCRHKRIRSASTQTFSHEDWLSCARRHIIILLLKAWDALRFTGHSIHDSERGHEHVWCSQPRVAQRNRKERCTDTLHNQKYKITLIGFNRIKQNKIKIT